ncbi:MAG: RNA polymerase sigma factor [Pseudobacteriovorax sp.]|nr:RNA polymerase sigma factor [Pseudobacteriovorax sp.]
MKTRTLEDKEDKQLVTDALGGDRESLATLLSRHHPMVYNFLQRLVLNPIDAEDLTQETLVKIVTRLDSFKGNSQFRTWVFQIAKNTFLDSKKRPLEHAIVGFSEYGQDLDIIPLDEDELIGNPERELLFKEAKAGCMMGMLLCLDRQQRLVYVLGEILSIESKVAAEILEVSPENFRKLLQRARKHIVSFMEDKCGLINKSNPCRCSKKTKGFIKEGWVDPLNLKFTDTRLKTIKEMIDAKNDDLSRLEKQYMEHFQSHSFLTPKSKKLVEIINSLGTRQEV